MFAYGFFYCTAFSNKMDKSQQQKQEIANGVDKK